jgi:branched-subunit amino acid ABC-type transport system permease component
MLPNHHITKPVLIGEIRRRPVRRGVADQGPRARRRLVEIPARLEGSGRPVQNAWYGLSLGSVLLLAAIGLAITFGVMGVINMAHGEMVMIGAYTTFVVQEVIQGLCPACSTGRSPIAMPLRLPRRRRRRRADRARHHPLSLRPPAGDAARDLGLSLILQQAVRTLFGPTNREVGPRPGCPAPSMSSADVHHL